MPPPTLLMTWLTVITERNDCLCSTCTKHSSCCISVLLKYCTCLSIYVQYIRTCPSSLQSRPDMLVASGNPPHVWFVLYLCVHMYVQLSIGCVPRLRDFQGSQEPPFKYKATINLKQNSAMLYKRMNYTAATGLLSFWYTIEESLCLYLRTTFPFIQP